MRGASVGLSEELHHLETHLRRNGRATKLERPIESGGGGSGEDVGRVLRHMNGLLWAAFPGYQDTNAFNHFGGRTPSLWEKDIGAAGPVEGSYGTGYDHGRKRRMQLFGATDEFVAVHLRHEQVTEKQIERAGKGLLDHLKRRLRGKCWNDAVTTGFEKEGSD